MKTKEILETLAQTDAYEAEVVPASWAQQLAKDLRIAVDTLEYIAQARGDLWWIADEALRGFDL